MSMIQLRNSDGEEVEFDGDDVELTRKRGHGQHKFVIETELLRKEFTIPYWEIEAVS